VGGVAFVGGRVLLIKRRFEPLAGRWSLPGGALEVGETLAEGLAREMNEETGLDVDVGPVVDVFDRITRDDDGRARFHYVLVDFLCTVRAGTPMAGSDVAEVALAEPGDLARYGLTAKTLEVIERARALAG
jgi:ADP-ribose pyrophosphatase YjhB (NUDIX family)